MTPDTINTRHVSSQTLRGWQPLQIRAAKGIKIVCNYPQWIPLQQTISFPLPVFNKYTLSCPRYFPKTSKDDSRCLHNNRTPRLLRII